MIKRHRFARRGFSLIELIITMTILAILISISAPSVIQSVEQSHADLAGAGLRMIQTAQRFYWLDNRTYSTDLQTLIDARLIDGNLAGTATRYEYSISAATDSTFQVQARRRLLDDFGGPIYDGAWQGTLTIDETGAMTGTVSGPASSITGVTPVLAPAF
jgi:prepilin-type N-terminal cleavage/methylation domain-containing protein